MSARPPPNPRPTWSNLWTQFFPPSPVFTEKDLPDLSGKVFVVTGSNTGVGFSLATMLYSQNARVYIVARSREKSLAAIESIRASNPASRGSLVYQYLDLADLSGIRASADAITAREPAINVLFNNAAVQALDPNGPTVTAQGHEIHLGVNVLGVWLFTHYLTEVLVRTARTEPEGSVRVVWVSSLGTEMVGEKDKGLSPAYTEYWRHLRPLERYGISKAGNWLHAVEFARLYREKGVISVACNPGHLRSDLYRSGSWLLQRLTWLISYPVVNGACTELFCGLSPDITMETTGDWIVPFGRLYPIRNDLLAATRSAQEGGNGHAQDFWAWTQEMVKDFL